MITIYQSMRLNYYICVVGEPWDTDRGVGQSGEDDKRALQEVHGREVQRACCKQRP